MINDIRIDAPRITSAAKNNSFLMDQFTSNIKNKGDILRENTSKYFASKIELSSATENNAEQFLQEIKPLIRYTLIGDNGDYPNNNDLKQSIDALRTNQNSSHSLNKPTKSMIDFVATLYIAYVYRQKNGENEIKNIFCSEKFKDKFKNFLKTQCGINPDKIPDSYLDSIKYTQFATIKFNNYTLDISRIGSDGLKKVNATVKNTSIREYSTVEEIKSKKEEAQQYYETIHGKINQIIDPEQRKQVILNVIYFNKVLNAIQRKFVRTKMNHFDLLKLASPIFVALGIDAEKEQIEFINHSIFLNFHQNKGLWVKRVFIQIPLITIATAALAATVLGALWLARDWWFTLIGAGVEGLHDCEGVGRDMILEKLGGNFNVGDRINSYTNGMDKVFTKLCNAFDGLQNAQNKSYQQSNAWKYLPRTENIMNHLKNKNISVDEQIRRHQYIMQNCVNMGDQFRDADLATLRTHYLWNKKIKQNKDGTSYLESYYGEINDYGLPSGRGKMIWSDSGHIYEGEFANGVPHGVGILIKGDQRFEVRYESNMVIHEKNIEIYYGE